MKTPLPPKETRVLRSRVAPVSSLSSEGLSVGPSYTKEMNENMLQIVVESSVRYHSSTKKGPALQKKQNTNRGETEKDAGIDVPLS